MTDHQEPSKSFFDKLSGKFFHNNNGGSPEEMRDELSVALQDARGKNVLDDDALHMMEGVLHVSELRAGDIMVPRAQMVVLDVSDDSQTWIRQVIEAGHSRFPVIDGDKDNVLGILLAKDLLRVCATPEYRVRDHLRQAVFVPETKPLDDLLKEFRLKQNHLALVVDEFGSISGIITMEDVLEEIVGEIDDEYDTTDEEATNIIATGPDRWKVKARTHIDDFNRSFGTTFEDDRFETIGGLVTDLLEHVPKVGESAEIGGLRFKTMKATARQPQLFSVEKIQQEAEQPEQAEAAE